MRSTVVQTTYYFNLMLTALINPALAAPTVLAAAKQGLSKQPFTPTVGTVYGDMLIPSYTGYAVSATIVWGLPINEIDGSQTSFAPSTLFRATAVPTPETIYGGFVGDGVAAPGTGILGSYLIAPNVPIQNPGDGLAVLIGWNLGPASGNCQANISV